MGEILAEITAAAGELTSTRRHLHAHPELSGQERETSDYLMGRLTELGLSPTRPVDGEMGIVASIHGTAGEGGRAVGLRADIDALPIAEETGLPFASQREGVMHACGHDAHAAMLLGAAAYLCRHRGEFAGEVRLIFQPGEEFGLGARPLIEAGATQGLCRVLGIHAASSLPVGTIAVPTGPSNAGVDGFKIEIEGKGAHVARPHQGADALLIGCEVVGLVQALRTRLVSPTEPTLIGIGTFHAGNSYNQVADRAVIEGSNRITTEQTRELLRQAITKVAEDTARAFGGRATATFRNYCYTTSNPAGAAAEVQGSVRRLGSAVTLLTSKEITMAGDNFSDFQREVPGVYAHLGTGSDEVAGSRLPHHNCRFTIDERALPLGAALYAQFALDTLSGGAGQA
ncbi:MAG: amidohydrolase [Succinivibrionaceae bacterium]|nr:amidohydrolase [Succinivibrionaceae bacterium]